MLILISLQTLPHTSYEVFKNKFWRKKSDILSGLSSFVRFMFRFLKQIYLIPSITIFILYSSLFHSSKILDTGKLSWYSDQIREWTIRGSNHPRGEMLISSARRPDRLGGQPSLLIIGYEVFSRGKAAGATSWLPHPQLLPRLRINGAISLIPLYAVIVWAWTTLPYKHSIHSSKSTGNSVLLRKLHKVFHHYFQKPSKSPLTTRCFIKLLIY